MPCRCAAQAHAQRMPCACGVLPVCDQCTRAVEARHRRHRGCASCWLAIQGARRAAACVAVAEPGPGVTLSFELVQAKPSHDGQHNADNDAGLQRLAVHDEQRAHAEEIRHDGGPNLLRRRRDKPRQLHNDVAHDG